jgi:type IV pilus assembly protein PilM
MRWSLGSEYLIGIDIGETHVAAAQLKRKKSEFVIRGLYYRDLDRSQENGDALATALKEIAKNKTFSGRRVVLSVPSRNLSIFPIRFQLEKDGALEEAIVRESEKLLPFPIGEAVIDYPSLLPDGDGDAGSYKALVVAIRREDLTRYLALLRKAGFCVDAFDFSVSALLRLHNYLYQMSLNPVILGHIGNSTSQLVVATRERIAIHRDVGWGSGMLIGEFLAGIDITDDRSKAKAILHKYGLAFESREATQPDTEQDVDAASVERAIYQIVTPYVDELLFEMDKTVSYVRAEERQPTFEGIYLYDQANMISALDAYVERRMNIPTEVVNPLQRIALSDAALKAAVPEDASCALALGLAMRRVSWL